MNASMHPTIDQIADHEAGLLPSDQADVVASHLADCSECHEVVARLTEVSDLLAEAGHDVPAIPDDVAASLDAALARAAAEREAGVSSLADRRTPAEVSSPTAPVSRPTRHRGRLLLGAAAAVVVFAVGGAVVSNGLPGGSSQDSTAGRSADQQSSAGGDSKTDAPGSAEAPNGAQESRRIPPRAAPTLDETNVSAYAAGLADSRVPVARPPVRCTPPPAPTSAHDSTAVQKANALVTFNGEGAVLQVDPESRRFTVFACPGPTRVLYRSAY